MTTATTDETAAEFTSPINTLATALDTDGHKGYFSALFALPGSAAAA